ncbi:unnamed protein product [Rotaria sordida]|uniref:Uncharacterized protein n=1 Tax=Rotaria sordida TaxID=392033 RepID=A0A814HC06_9BILA|nr:unnamed protein product [Rotaria sordida]CAF1109059.1 unnamed protein product [Rotaria sordida]CAF1136416.1 unnamed protein product [Rotaria sordida]
MAYTGSTSNYQAIYTGSTRSGSSQQQQQAQHIYEEQPHYVNERPISRQNFGGDDRRSEKILSDIRTLNY